MAEASKQDGETGTLPAILESLIVGLCRCFVHREPGHGRMAMTSSLLALVALAWAVAGSQVPAAEAFPVVQTESSCTAGLNLEAVAPRPRLCETTRIVARLAATCPRPRIHFVIVRQERVPDRPWLIDVADDVLDQLEATTAELHAAVVLDTGYNTQVWEDWTTDVPTIRAAVRRRLAGDGVSRMNSEGAELAFEMLDAARATIPESAPAPTEMVLFFSAYKRHEQEDAIRAAVKIRGALKDLDTIFAAACPERQDPERCAAMAESIPRWDDRREYAMAPDGRPIEDFFAEHLKRVAAGVTLERALLDIGLPAGSSPVDGSDLPPEAEITRQGGQTRIRWHWDLEAMPGLPAEAGIEVRPLGLGSLPITATLQLTDLLGGMRAIHDGLILEVEDDCLTPTPEPTIAPSATPTSHPSATQSPTPVPTATEASIPLFLPIALLEQCSPSRQQADIVLVIDTSSSMTGSKIEAAREAATTFVRAVSLPDDRIGVVTFSEQATTLAGLTGDEALLEASIQGITPQPGTRIDRGLERARDVLADGARGGEHPQVIVLLTDGRQVEEPQRALDVARSLRERGVRTFAIGLGQDVDEAFLREIAGVGTRYYFAPDEGELGHIYELIAATIPCPAEDFWGRR